LKNLCPSRGEHPALKYISRCFSSFLELLVLCGISESGSESIGPVESWLTLGPDPKHCKQGRFITYVLFLLQLKNTNLFATRPGEEGLKEGPGCQPSRGVTWSLETEKGPPPAHTTDGTSGGIKKGVLSRVGKNPGLKKTTSPVFFWIFDLLGFLVFLWFFWINMPRRESF
jgi:hypothetical protein